MIYRFGSSATLNIFSILTLYVFWIQFVHFCIVNSFALSELFCSITLNYHELTKLYSNLYLNIRSLQLVMVFFCGISKETQALPLTFENHILKKLYCCKF